MTSHDPSAPDHLVAALWPSRGRWNANINGTRRTISRRSLPHLARTLRRMAARRGYVVDADVQIFEP